MDAAMVHQVRQFNRTVTQRIGALEESFLSRDRPLGEARLLWEIGNDGCDVRELRARLDLDSGYLSRLLRALEAAGLVVVRRGETDARVRTAALTRRGRREVATLDRLSDEGAVSILEPLNLRQRQRLVAAMAEVERLLVASTVTISVCEPGHSDARVCMSAYFRELADRFPDGFDPELSISAADAELVLPAGLLLVARLHSEPVGCGALKFHGTEPAEIKRMWVSSAVRGLGLGRRLLAELEAHAAAKHVTTVRLETNDSLTEAISLYRESGYQEVPAFNNEPYAHHWFEKKLSIEDTSVLSVSQPGCACHGG